MWFLNEFDTFEQQEVVDPKITGPASTPKYWSELSRAHNFKKHTIEAQTRQNHARTFFTSLTLALAMNLSKNFVDLNNKAVACLSQGHYDESVAALGDALSSLKLCRDLEDAAARLEVVQQSYSNPQQFTFPIAGGEQSVKKAHCPLSSVALTFTDSQHQQQQKMTAFNSTFSIFNRALTISNANDLESSVSKNYNRLMTMLLYNMALALHIKAVRTGKTTELEGSLQLYEMSFSVLEDAWSQFDVNDMLLFLLAIFVNMAHIHSVLFNGEKTRTCIQWLKALAANPVFLQLMQRTENSPFFLELLVVLKQERFLVCSPAA
jgi:hypothetical protein